MEPYPTMTIKTITSETFWGTSIENILEIFGIFFLKIYKPKTIAFENISNHVSDPVSYTFGLLISNPILSNPFGTIETDINAGNTTAIKLINDMIRPTPKTAYEILEYDLFPISDDFFNDFSDGFFNKLTIWKTTFKNIILSKQNKEITIQEF